MTTAEDQLAATVRVEGARILATLIRTVGFQLAEDAVQEAVLAALTTWPRTGVPDNPRAWLNLAARHKAIDLLRRERARGDKEREGSELVDLSRPDPPPDTAIRDDQLRLIFTCCHPTLAAEAQVTLALRTLCGLSILQISSVLLTSEAAVSKRLTRTRQKIALAQIPYRVPTDAELPSRMGTACSVVHALYTLGHTPTSGESAVDVTACVEAIRLARLLHDLLPDEALPAGLLALLLLTQARRPARLSPAGELVLLADQDRRLWDAGMIAEGAELLAASLRRTRAVADPYQLQAAVAVEHARSASYRSTDWSEVVRLYDLLVSVAPSPAAELNRAVAVAELSGPGAGLTALERCPASPRWHAVRAELLARRGDLAAAVVAVTASLEGQMTDPERRFRTARLAEWAVRAGAGSEITTAPVRQQ